MFDARIVVAVREDLLVWQKLNVASFLAGGIAGSSPELIGQAYADASGTTYGTLIRQPILIFAGGPEDLRKAHARAGAERSGSTSTSGACSRPATTRPTGRAWLTLRGTIWISSGWDSLPNERSLNS